MISKTKLLAAALALAVPLATTACSREPETVDRWATTENTNVAIDWNKVNEAYKTANGPEDLEKKINEIYEGDEVISISVKDSEADKTQIVTGFFDKNTNGTVEDEEKIFTIKREPTPEGAQYSTQGHGHYAGYSSPFFSIVSGMLVGSMISSMFMPRYIPMGYVTSPSRVGDIRSQRQAYRASNPSRFPGKASQSGRNYGGRPTGTRPSGGGGRRGGGGFGLKRAGRAVRPQRLTA